MFQHSGFKECFFIRNSLDVFEGKNKRCHKQLTKLGRNKVLQSGPRTAIFVVSFANFKSCTLSRHPSGDRVMPHTEVCVRAQASHGNITVLSHLNFIVIF